MENKEFDTIIVGGSYAGLSAAMALGRSLRSVLIIDSGLSCNRQTPHSHNFLTQDGATPREISEAAKKQVLKYPTVKFSSDTVISAARSINGFEVLTQKSQKLRSKKILFATGVKDIMPDMKGFADCWGISVLHCPYCHGYEVAHKNLGILANGDTAFELCQLIQHWSGSLTLFTDGKSALTEEQWGLVRKLGIGVVEKKINELIYDSGHIAAIAFEDGNRSEIDAIFARVPFEQHCGIPATMGCKMTEQGYIEVDFSQQTSVEGVFCAGDNTTPLRAVSLAVSSGTIAGASINMQLLSEELPTHSQISQ